MNSAGASICDHELTTLDTRDIAFPYQSLALEHVSVDVGGSLAKVVYFSRGTHVCKDAQETLSYGKSQAGMEDPKNAANLHTMDSQG